MTVVSPEGSADESADIEKECDRLARLGVTFRTKPAKTGPATIAVFEDTCGNLIQLHQT